MSKFCGIKIGEKTSDNFDFIVSKKNYPIHLQTIKRLLNVGEKIVKSVKKT